MPPASDRRTIIPTGAVLLWVTGVLAAGAVLLTLFVGLSFASMVNPYQPADRQRAEFIHKVVMDEPIPMLMFGTMFTGSFYLMVTAATRNNRPLLNFALAATFAWTCIGLLIVWFLAGFTEAIP